jgi:hypothetical protein
MWERVHVPTADGQELLEASGRAYAGEDSLGAELGMSVAAVAAGRAAEERVHRDGGARWEAAATFDNAGDLVAGDHAHGRFELAPEEVEVAAADPGGQHADERLAGGWLRVGAGLKRQAGIVGPRCGSHDGAF